MLPYISQVRGLCVCFLRRVFSTNYINVVQTYCKQKFRRAIVGSLRIGAREVSRSSAAKPCLAYRRTHGIHASGKPYGKPTCLAYRLTLSDFEMVLVFDVAHRIPYVISDGGDGDVSSRVLCPYWLRVR